MRSIYVVVLGMCTHISVYVYMYIHYRLLHANQLLSTTQLK